jgi:hypothetical protein
MDALMGVEYLDRHFQAQSGVLVKVFQAGESALLVRGQRAVGVCPEKNGLSLCEMPAM